MKEWSHRFELAVSVLRYKELFLDDNSFGERFHKENGHHLEDNPPWSIGSDAGNSRSLYSVYHAPTISSQQLKADLSSLSDDSCPTIDVRTETFRMPLPLPS